MKNPLIGIIMGSDSDLLLMQECTAVLEDFGVAYEISIVSCHRTPERLVSYAQGVQKRGLKIIIACAGGAAHLPGMAASLTTLPVIGVPRELKTLQGLDSLLSIVQMPSGVPVATMAINGAKNAGLFAIKMLAIADTQLAKKMIDYQTDLKNMIEAKAAKLEKEGVKKYLASQK